MVGLVPIAATDDPPIVGEVVSAATATDMAPARPRTPIDGARAPSFALFDELEQRHLNAYRAEHSSHWGELLRAEIKAWDNLRIELMRRLVAAHSDLAAILREAPTGSLPDPEASATELLDAACPHELEEQHLRSYLSQHSSDWGELLRAEIDAWNTTRIELASAKARGLVDLLNEQARRMPPDRPQALPAATKPEPGAKKRYPKPAKPNGSQQRTAHPDRPKKGWIYRATVTRMNAHGAVVSLDSGEQGWLHVSKLRGRGIGVSDRGNVLLDLVGTGIKKPASADAPATPAEPSTAAVQTSVADQRPGFLSRLPWSRSRRTQP
jgi:hypothetical protein